MKVIKKLANILFSTFVVFTPISSGCINLHKKPIFNQKSFKPNLNYYNYKKYIVYLPEAIISEKDMKSVYVKKQDAPEYLSPFWKEFIGSYRYSFKDRNEVHKIAKQKDYRKIVEQIKTPLKTAIYCTDFLEYARDLETYGEKDYHASFKHIHKNKKDDCDGGSLSTAAILGNDGFPSYILYLFGKNSNVDHEVFIYKNQDGKFGSLGKNYSDINAPVYNSICELINSIESASKHKYEDYLIYDLKKAYPNFVDNDENNDFVL